MFYDLLLPIADIVVNPWLIIAVGFIGGILTGLLGVGGGLFITPTLMALGIPPIIAVASQVNSMIGVTLTGYLTYKKNNDVDYPLSRIIILGGLVGAAGGIYLLKWLGSSELIKKLITVSYIFLIGMMAILLFRQSAKNLARLEAPGPEDKPKSPVWITKFPFVHYFSRSRVTISLIVLFSAGLINGLLIAILGIGNGIFMMPVLIYFMGKASPVSYGTTLLSSVILTMTSTFAHALYADFIDLVLVALLSIGGALGGQIGVRYSYRLPRVYLGFAGSGMMVLMLIQVSFNFFFPELLSYTKDQNIELLKTDFHLWIQDFESTFPLLYAAAGIALSISLTYGFQFLKSMGKRLNF